MWILFPDGERLARFLDGPEQDAAYELLSQGKHAEAQPADKLDPGGVCNLVRDASSSEDEAFRMLTRPGMPLGRPADAAAAPLPTSAAAAGFSAAFAWSCVAAPPPVPAAFNSPPSIRSRTDTKLLPAFAPVASLGAKSASATPGSGAKCKCTCMNCQRRNSVKPECGPTSPGFPICRLCKCANATCPRASYRSRFCFACCRAAATLPPVMALVEGLSPVLSQLQPSDVESFLRNYERCEDNLFALVILAWSSDPWALDFLAPRLRPVVDEVRAYQLLAEAAQRVSVPEHLHLVNVDLKRQRRVGEASGFVRALTSLGVIELAVDVSVAPRRRAQLPAVGLRGRVLCSSPFHVAGSTELYRLTGNPELVGLALTVCRAFHKEQPPPERDSALLLYAEALLSMLAKLPGMSLSGSAPLIQFKILTGHLSRLKNKIKWRVKLDVLRNLSPPDNKCIFRQLKLASPKEYPELTVQQLSSRLRVKPMDIGMWCYQTSRQLSCPRLRKHQDFDALVNTEDGHDRLLAARESFRSSTLDAYNPSLGRVFRMAMGIESGEEEAEEKEEEEEEEHTEDEEQQETEQKPVNAEQESRDGEGEGEGESEGEGEGEGEDAQLSQDLCGQKRRSRQVDTRSPVLSAGKLARAAHRATLPSAGPSPAAGPATPSLLPRPRPRPVPRAGALPIQGARCRAASSSSAPPPTAKRVRVRTRPGIAKI